MIKNFHLSVIIKAYNEEKNIARCIESVLAEIDPTETEVIVVDSCSTDGTLVEAMKYPVKIVQFENKEECNASAAAQLGYQCSSGSYILLIDGDMVLIQGFLKSALDYMHVNPDVAGVGGILKDVKIRTQADQKRVDTYSKMTEIRRVNCLGGGGLYRRDDIEEVGYFAHTGLKACEESELGVRLRYNGKLLVRLPIYSCYHDGHNETNLQMCLRLWRNKRLAAYTEYLKISFEKPWFLLVLKECWFSCVVLAALCLYFSALIIFDNLIVSLSFLSGWFFIYLLLAIKKRSFQSAAWSVLLWWLLFFASIPCFFSQRIQMLQQINCKYLKV